MSFGLFSALRDGVETEIALREPTESESLRMIHALTHGASVEAIAEALRVTPGVVSAWLERWQTTQKNPAADDPMRAAALARRAEAVKRWQSKISTESAALSVDAIALARNSVELGDARGFGDAARGIKTLVEITRQAEGLDANGSGSSGGASLALFVLRVGENGVQDTRPIVNVTPPIETEPEF